MFRLFDVLTVRPSQCPLCLSGEFSEEGIVASGCGRGRRRSSEDLAHRLPRPRPRGACHPRALLGKTLETLIHLMRGVWECIASFAESASCFSARRAEPKRRGDELGSGAGMYLLVRVGVVFDQACPRTKRGCQGIPLSLLRNASARESLSRVDGQLLRPKAPMGRRLVGVRLDRYRFSC